MDYAYLFRGFRHHFVDLRRFAPIVQIPNDVEVLDFPGLPKNRNPRNPQAAVVIGKRRRHHFQVANASDRLHCDNVPKPLTALSRRLFLIACAQSYRESGLARNVTALHAAF